MKLDKAYRPELVVSNEQARSYCVCHLSTEEKRLVATDGSMMISLPCNVEPGDTTGPVAVDTLKTARKLAGKRHVLEIKATADLYTLADGSTAPRKDHGQFPSYQQVFSSSAVKETDNTITFGVDADLLAAVQKAMGAKAIRLTVKLPEQGKDMLDPILVRDGNGSTDAIGLVMPYRSK